MYPLELKFIVGVPIVAIVVDGTFVNYTKLPEVSETPPLVTAIVIATVQKL